MKTKRRLLVVDDVPDNLEFLSVLLGEKYDVLSYVSPQEALCAVRDIRPDLLLLDVHMLPINGVDFLQTVRSLDGFSDIPAIAVTAMAYEVAKGAFLGAGFQAIVVKPICDLTKLEANIDSLMEMEVPNSPSSQEDASEYVWRT